MVDIFKSLGMDYMLSLSASSFIGIHESILNYAGNKNPEAITCTHEEISVAMANGYAKIDGKRIGMVGGSYSGEEMAESGREHGYAQAYVELSPGSFSEESIRGIDASGVPWLFIVSRDERHLRDITAAVQAQSKIVELVVLPGTEHATRILNAHPSMAERIAVWLAEKLK